MHFRLSERHNPNMSILSSENSFVERILFWVLLLEKMSNYIESFDCSATQTLNGYYSLGVVVGDSLRRFLGVHEIDVEIEMSKKMAVKPIKNDNFLCLAKSGNNRRQYHTSKSVLNAPSPGP